MTKEEVATVHAAFKPYIAILKEGPVFVLIGREGGKEALDFWRMRAQGCDIENLKLSWNEDGRNYIWSCKVSLYNGGWRRVEELTSSAATAENAWSQVMKESKLFKESACVVMMSSPALNEMCRRLCKRIGTRCLTWSSKIGLIADGFQKKATG